jgi:hypothetical protein
MFDPWPSRTRRLTYRVKVLKCHRDRTKKIATENSPFLFMTVSEDGTVRQHDLRRPHRCRSECPDPLFRAPQGVDLYSLSVSTPAPHIFAVAGRTDTVSPLLLPQKDPSEGADGRHSYVIGGCWRNIIPAGAIKSLDQVRSIVSDAWVCQIVNGRKCSPLGQKGCSPGRGISPV